MMDEVFNIQKLIDKVKSTGRLWFASYRKDHIAAKEALKQRVLEIQTFNDLGDIPELLSALEYFDQTDYSPEIADILQIKKPLGFLSNSINSNRVTEQAKPRLREFNFNPEQQLPLIFYIRLVHPNFYFNQYPDVKRALDHMEERGFNSVIEEGRDPNARITQAGCTTFQLTIQNRWNKKIKFSKKTTNKELEQLLIYGADINAQDYGHQGSYDAITINDFLYMAGLIGPPPREGGGNTALHYAVQSGAELGNENTVGTIKWLVAKGAHPEILNQAGKTAADLTDNPEIKKYLRDNMSLGRLINPISARINNSRFWSREKYKADLKTALEKYVELWRPDLHAKDNIEFDKLLSALELHSYAEIKEILTLKGHDYSLLYILRYGRAELENYPKIKLIAREINLETDQELYDAVLSARAEQKTAKAREAARMGIDLNTKTQNGVSLLINAVRNPAITLEAFEELVLEFKLKLDSSDDWGKAFIFAVKAKRYDIANKIKQKMFGGSIKDRYFGEANKQNTLLHIMARAGDLAVVKDLVESYGFNSCLVNADGLRPAGITRNPDVRVYLENKMKFLYAGKHFGDVINPLSKKINFARSRDREKYKPDFKIALKKYVEVWEMEQNTKALFNDLFMALEFFSKEEIKELLKFRNQDGYSLLYILRHKGFNFEGYPKIKSIAQEIDQELYAEVLSVRDAQKTEKALQAAKMGIDRNTKTREGLPIFVDAAGKLSLEAFEALIPSSIKVLDEKFLVSSSQLVGEKKNWARAFVQAVRVGNYAVADKIKDQKFSGNIKNALSDRHGFLHIMARVGNLAVVKALVERYELDPNAKNEDGLTPEEVTKNPEVRKYLESKMTKTLDYAVRNRDFDLFKELVGNASNKDKIDAYELILKKDKEAEGFFWIKRAWYQSSYVDMQDVLIRFMPNYWETFVSSDDAEVFSSDDTQSAEESGLKAVIADKPGLVPVDEKAKEDVVDVNAEELRDALWRAIYRYKGSASSYDYEQICKLINRLEFFQEDVIDAVLKYEHPEFKAMGNLSGLLVEFINKKQYPKVHRVMNTDRLPQERQETAAWPKAYAPNMEVVQQVANQRLLAQPVALKEKTIKVQIHKRPSMGVR